MSGPAHISTDALVIGGGPAGAATATMLARAGARTVVAERVRFPRDKVCGEFLSAEGCRVLERLGVLERLLDAGAVWMGVCRITHPRGPVLDVPLPALDGNGREGLGVSRARLDRELLELAASCGAEVLQPWEAVRPLFAGGRVCGAELRRTGSDTTLEVRASLVIAADGRRSMLGRRLHPELGDPRKSDPRSWFGLAVHLDARGRSVLPRIELHLFRGGYAGIGPVEGGRLNLGMIVTVAALRACDGSPDKLLEQRLLANTYLRETIGSAAACGPWKSVGPLRWGARRPTASGVMFVGDAAGTVDPFCGEGIANALCGAELALPHALEAVARGGLTDDLAARYDAGWSRVYSNVTRRVRRLGRLLERPRLARPVLQLLAGAGRSVAPRLVFSTRTNRSV